jgi:hypothetical protein
MASADDLLPLAVVARKMELSRAAIRMHNAGMDHL